MSTQPSLPQLTSGYVPAQVLRAAAELRVADSLADGPRDYLDLAKRTSTDPDALRRLLRALAGLGLVRQADADQFELTDLGRQLAGGTPAALREQILLATAPPVWHAWSALAAAVRDGMPPRQQGTGLTAYQSVLSDPALAAAYRAAKAQSSRALAPAVIPLCDFARFGTIAVLGPDDGALMAAILSAVPSLRGVLCDDAAGGQEASQVAALERSRITLREARVDGRCEVITGGIAAIPPGTAAYLFNHLIRDYDEDQAAAALRACRASITLGGTLMLLETLTPRVLSPGDSMTYGLTDLNCLVFCGGRERTREEYQGLLELAGFTLTTVTSVPAAPGLPSPSVIEAIAA